MIDVRSELRSALRSLAHAPGLALTATLTLTLALAIGGVTAIFTVVNGVLLRALPYPESDRLVALHRISTLQEADLSLPDITDLRRELTQLSGVAAFASGWDLDLTREGTPQRLRATVAGPEYFEVLGGAPEAGRTYGPADGVLTALCASLLPARRAARVDPLTALRSD